MQEFIRLCPIMSLLKGELLNKDRTKDYIFRNQIFKMIMVNINTMSQNLFHLNKTQFDRLIIETKFLAKNVIKFLEI